MYQIALTHKSASYTLNGERVNNERLEYLGDSILDAVISDYLYKKYPSEREGFLTEMRSKIVNGEKLKELAVNINLDQFIIQRTNIQLASSRIYEDAFEALIGAIYLDKGYRAVSRFISQKIIDEHIDFGELEVTNYNYKSRLIEWSQKTKSPVEFSSFISDENSNSFISEVVLEEKIIGKGLGNSKKEAEQNAAREALISLGELDD
ncbi:MAG: ribonuclease III [Chloroflexia bacterium]|nr:ribonuclease III [Chloroflexia bacterium]